MIVEVARAKLNLALHVRGRRGDGYHELDTLFAFVRDGDSVAMTAAAEDDFRITGPFAAGLESDATNLVVRARDRFRARVAPLPPVSITLDKRLPVASGIGGGSADAAATLRAASRMVDVPVDAARLMRCAAELGSDVPACLISATAIGRGRGEALTPIAGAALPVLLVNPQVPVATARVFAGWDGIDRGPLGDGAALSIARAGRNDLTVPAVSVAPVIGDVLAWLERLPGVGLVRMSGSGATCFATFDDPGDCRAAADATRAAHAGWWCLETALA